MALTNYPNGISSFGVPVLPSVSGVPFTGKAFFVNPATGADGNPGTDPSLPLATLYAAHALCTAGNNDVVYLIGNGGTSATARLSLANAVSVDSTATTGTLTWSKNATHLIGVSSPSNNSRARIAPPTGAYTEATFNALPFITMSATGCVWENISVFHGFSTGANGQIALNLTGQRNVFNNCQIQGMNDAASAQGTASRSVVITAGGENVFNNCQIGGDTTTRTVANATLEFATGTARNTFSRCTFPFQGSAATLIGILGTGASCMDRWQLFDRCIFVNNVKSTSTAMTALVNLTSASPGGLLIFKDCDTIGMTKIGDTNGLANSYVSNVGGAATGGLALNPT
jgi:hypothetical protein